MSITDEDDFDPNEFSIAIENEITQIENKWKQVDGYEFIIMLYHLNKISTQQTIDLLDEKITIDELDINFDELYFLFKDMKLHPKIEFEDVP